MLRWLIVISILSSVGVVAFAMWPTPLHTGPTSVHTPDGWMHRLDAVITSVSGTVTLVEEKPGVFLAKNGPNTIFFREEDKATGHYSVATEVHHLSTFEHSHGAGLLFGGKNLLGAKQRYSYFLVRDGHYLIKIRNGDKTEAITPWTKHVAIVPEKDGVANNKLRVDVGPEDTIFFVNDKEIDRTKTKALHVDGVYGFRMVHDLELRFTQPKHTPKKSE